MEPLNKDSILKEIPLFAGLTKRQRNLIKERCGFVEYKKGEVIYEEGSPPNAFYSVVLGRVVIYAKDKYGCESIKEFR